MKKTGLTLLCALVLWAGSSMPGYGGDEGGLEISGLIIDRTRTKVGQDFFRLFSSLWEPLDGEDFTIVIAEEFHPRFGNTVVVVVNGAEVYRSLLAFRYDAVQKAARQGVDRAKNFVLNEMAIFEELEMY